jgi:hypothetical protein
VTSPPSLPDFYIVGAPKSGTSALYHYLDAHPAVAMSREKEPSYWSDDIPKRGQTATLDAYYDQWRGAPAAAMRGEASVWYVYSAVAIPRILAATPEARFILMLRNPVDMAQAWHAQLLRSFDENVGSFEKAWRLQEERRGGRRIPPECFNPHHLQYQSICALAEPLERFVRLVPAQQRLTLLFEDFAAAPSATYRDVLRFLDLPDDGRRDFPKVNAHRRPRHAWMTNLHRAAPRLLGRAYAPLRRAARTIGLHPSAGLNLLNVAQGPRPPLRPVFRAELVEAFAPEVDRIEAILARNLPAWRE